MSSFNEKIIEEFRQNAGRVAGPFAGVELLLLTTTGRHSGQPRIAPLAYTADGDDLVVAASNGGSDRHPDWYYNIQDDATVTVEVGERSYPATAVIPDGPERDRLWAAHVAAMPNFADYETVTDRPIPVVVLRPAS
ncbi:nitroreductase family deazaflavin-dependent oxidoreductase [Jiangella gansuensis]|uniref:nitroreductase family deazaflavin-dependent oxidoreductase n=1 Tax=Jiangella gansuensis TaxID=281473 RepID=UPI00047A210D|nr:nitroreductase family deazaflavin-dependent oxidoreductase [Jiangella gansuensis]